MRPNFLVPLELALFFGFAVWIVLGKRPPLATILWLLLVAALPIGGASIFLVVGPRRLRRVRLRQAVEGRKLRATFAGPLDPDERPGPPASAVALEPRFRQLLELGERSSQASLTSGNQVAVLRNGGVCFPAIEDAIGRAHHHVHLEYYIYRTDRTGTRLRDLLVERARSGVQVRLLVDAFGSGLSRRFLRPLIEAGAEVEPFNRVRLRLGAPGANFRSHRKIIICDGDVAFTGGLNVGDSYAGLDPRHPIRDTHVRIDGPAARAFQLLFLEDWQLATGRQLSSPQLMGSGQRPGGELVQVVASGADHRWHALQQMYFAAINAAQARVRISTAYFVPDQALLTALVAAALRGVEVQLLVPRRSDSRIVAAAGRSYYDELLAAGVRVYEYLPGFLHAKSLVVDGLCATVGTANLNRRSFNVDFEVNAFFYSAKVAAALDEAFVQDLAVSQEVTLEHRARLSLPSLLGEAAAHLLAPVL
jgi:cardiolipin synthase